MKDNPLLQIRDFGQSIWQDYIRRNLILSGDLERLIETDGIQGVTSNPSIFDKAIAGSHDYDDDIRAMALDGNTVEEIYQALTVRDVQQAADLFRPLYDASDGMHGFVSLEVNPHLAHDAGGTMAEAHRLWGVLDRPNVFIKVPATREGLTSIRRLIADGINVNVTLLFGLPRYREVARAYIEGLEDRVAQGKSIDRTASVASFFLSRIDVLVDPMLEKIMANGGDQADFARKCRGQAAIASAKKAYQIYKEMFFGDRFRKLTDKGARSQRVLWASTSTKNPEYSDVKYVEALIGPETVNTLPQDTLKAYRDHGRPAARLEDDLDSAERVYDGLSSLGIDIHEATRQLEAQGVEKFNKPYDSLMETLGQKRRTALAEPVNDQDISYTGADTALEKELNRMADEDFVIRLWEGDATLWGDGDRNREVVRNALGWLHVPVKMAKNVQDLTDFAASVKEQGFTHVVHMGMGGSSLAPLVFQRTFAVTDKGLSLSVLDTTDPATIADVERNIPLEKTLFIVASKSGTTAEPMAFAAYFYEKVAAIKGEKAGDHFVAVTDPGTPLVTLAEERNFRRVFLNDEDIGGRYSALSYFGLLPAALMGIDVGELLIRALRMRHACKASVPLDENPGVRLGAFLGRMAKDGCDKVTFLVPPGMATLGMWLEQLLAESTGKQGTGLLPVAGEPVGYPSMYGNDRIFIHIRSKNKPDARLDRSVAQLRHAGQPVIAIEVADRMDICQEFFRWEIATATAGAVLGINPFDQPNVQESKDNTNRLLQRVAEEGALPSEEAAVSEGALRLYSEETEPLTTVAEGLIRLLSRQVKPGDYLAILAYLTEEAATEAILDNIRLMLQSRLKVPATMGYGPRYLHSTGQLHKGGANTGIFLLLTADAPEDLDVPSKPYTFGVFRQSQAQGDLEALHKHGRRAVRIHLGKDQGAGLLQLRAAIETGLSGVKS